MPGFQLSPHAFACDADGQILFLDLRRDRYLSLEPADTDAFLAYLAQPAAPNGTLADQVLRLSEQLKAEGLDADETPFSAWPPAARPFTDITGYPPDRRLKLRLGDMARFFAAAVSASVRLKFLSLERVVLGARARQAALAGREAQTTASQVHDLVEIHRTLQPLIFTAKNHCLFDSLALHTFLTGYGVPVRWVFGVKRHPFLAHCWIQFDGVVCNDSLEHICLFHPIMEV